MRRRFFLAAAAGGLAGAFARAAWSDIAGTEPFYLTAANKPDNSTWLVGLTLSGGILFAQSLPGRGHAAAVHPARAEAVAFARRPGEFALVLDCMTGQQLAR